MPELNPNFHFPSTTKNRESENNFQIKENAENFNLGAWI